MLETQSDEVFISPDAEMPAKPGPASSKGSDKKGKKSDKGKKEVTGQASIGGDDNVDHARPLGAGLDRGATLLNHYRSIGCRVVEQDRMSNFVIIVGCTCHFLLV